ncbi:MAG: hypothetical protein Q3988_01750 [Gemella sp.]|nr:hypothetical protein [Gemella sp.]
MRKNRLSGAWGLIIWSILCLLLFAMGINSLFSSNQEDVRYYLKDNKVYGKSDNSDVAIRILNIIETDVQVDNTLFYVIETDNKVVLLESEKYDKDLKYIFDNKDKLHTGEYYLVVEKVPETESRGGGRRRSSSRTFYNITPEFMKDATEPLITNIDIDLDKINKKVEVFEYVSLSRYKNSNKSFFGFSSILGVVGTLLGFLAFWKIRKNIKEYRELDEAFPELRGDFSTIKTDAEYIDEKLRMLVYKGYLIIYYKGFSITRLSDLKVIQINKVVTKNVWIKRDSYNIDLYYLEDADGESRVESWLIKKYGKETSARAREFKEFMSKNHSRLGVRIMSS